MKAVYYGSCVLWKLCIIKTMRSADERLSNAFRTALPPYSLEV